MKMLTHILYLVCLFILTGCSYYNNSKSFFQNRDVAYLKARSTPPLKIPPGYTTVGFSSEYPVSNKEYPENMKRVSIVPPELLAENKKIKASG